ncbi:ankyrin repeat domain-containing protein 54 [Anoplolepis gracilipes]|uniref:ankyrin repeat domain-containing protein 54 n=1 Tax=Anoplolepis gracilipes TaxID=354296 RepID=UPI003BA1A2DF
MTSVDSGVETGNDSNDSSSVQHESQQQQVAGQVTSNSMMAISPVNYNDKFHSALHYMHSPVPVIVDGVLITPDIDNDKIAMKNDKAMWDEKMKMSKTCGKDENETDTIFKYRSVYRAKTKPHTSYKNSQYLKDWQIHHVGRKMRLAATVNNTMLMSMLLQSGVSPNNSDNDGRTPLHHAACRGYTRMVQLLLEHGADPNQRDCIGNTPLHLAAVNSKISVVTLLLTAGTNVLALDKYGYNPLQLARAKLRILRNYNNKDMDKVKQEIHDIVNMLLAYLLKQKNMQEQVETLSNFCSRLSLTNTSDQVQDDVKDLLANIDSLSITG